MPLVYTIAHCIICFKHCVFFRSNVNICSLWLFAKVQCAVVEYWKASYPSAVDWFARYIVNCRIVLSNFNKQTIYWYLFTNTSDLDSISLVNYLESFVISGTCVRVCLLLWIIEICWSVCLFLQAFPCIATGVYGKTLSIKAHLHKEIQLFFYLIRQGIINSTFLQN